MEEERLRASGARLLTGELRVWRLPSAAARRVAPAIERRGALMTLAPDVAFHSLNHVTGTDPLIPQEWWLPIVGADRAEPPGPGRPVIVIDRGLDLSHPEFAGRPATTALNLQTVNRIEFHGTAVASAAAAPVNGVGLIGVYPQADLRSYDMSANGVLTEGELVLGLLMASRSCPGVINLSIGREGPSNPILDQAIQMAVERGCVLVAAAGNSRRTGSPPVLPARLPHVLTIASTDRADRVSVFSNVSQALDLSAPGEDIWTAVPVATQPSGYALFDGTSFAAPIVAGATAWVWTARGLLDDTQIFDLMRLSARDVGPAGHDVDTGFGVLDIPRALAAPVPAVDPLEPNEDVDLVRPGGLTAAGKPALRGRSSLRARLDFTEDPNDVYRVWVPGRRIATVSARGDQNVELELWRGSTTTVQAVGTARGRSRIAASTRGGTAVETVRFRNRGRRGVYVYANVFAGPRVRATAYSLTLRTARP